MQKSIEVEYWVVDNEGALTAPGELADISEFTETEFVDCLFELKTPPCETIPELRRTFVEQFRTVLDRAAELDKALVPLGTPINSESIELRADERGEIQRQLLGTNFDYAKHCAGTHIHFEKRNVTDQLNTLIALDPALALCNSSPYFQGEYVASSARAHIYRRQCYADLPNHGQLWNYVDTVAEWHRRLEHCFDEFTERAAANGISRAQIDEHFTVDDAVWAPVRLRDEMPTVEWRSPDATLPSHVLQLVSDMDSIMEALHHTNVRIEGETTSHGTDDIVLPTFDSLHEYVDAAMIDGLDSEAVVDYLDRLGFQTDRYDPLTTEVDSGESVSLEDARELRLQYADRLERDLDRLQASA
ncbi:homolog to carboxylate-amine ligase [Natrialba magadii ATCC 43099]|uniref:Glutamate--cysteine ligase n=1 Tax=Natrialba magadii (strain ATCC 43099 / DSM 3394 / CCM 3739 / CIP 104546 / IAM 13178 / JCM 8861 / NBRC 102185 / NCIMB 2190 / MS3) TaxID=547559 RepID=D3SZY5_NATMM|nr:glutamate-cysteine ligase family protein [Natrialba magadii]ADD06395.1 homolog to carboxylate-amine ligase [Natrialba magadii ATCC 43099]ELY31578.1 glutamate--cysteine ligase [Natrialba magadii ATCC 43099]